MSVTHANDPSIFGIILLIDKCTKLTFEVSQLHKPLNRYDGLIM